MKSVAMSTWPRVRISVIVLALGLWLSGVGPASAEPSAGCRELAARFANGAAELDLSGLASLVTCVSAEMQGRTGGPVAAPPPEPPAPPPSQPSSSFRETWPAPAPWGGGPWGGPWPSEGPGVR